MDLPLRPASTLVSDQDDRRTFRRFPLVMLAFVRLPNAPTPSLSDSAFIPQEALYSLQAVPVKDISMTGLFYYSRLAYPLKEELEVRLCLDGTEFVVPTVVERRTRVDNRLYGYGVNFRQSQASKEFRVALAAFLLRRADEKVGVPAGITRS